MKTEIGFGSRKWPFGDEPFHTQLHVCRVAVMAKPIPGMRERTRELVCPLSPKGGSVVAVRGLQGRDTSMKNSQCGT